MFAVVDMNWFGVEMGLFDCIRECCGKEEERELN